MHRKILVFPILFSLFLPATLFAAAEKPETAAASVGQGAEAKHAKELLARAVDYYKANKDRALAVFNRQGEFIDGELYVYVVGTNGQMLASGGSSSVLIGRFIADMTDVAGKPFFKEMLEVAQAKGFGTVEYKWLNRVDRKIERKITYFQKVDDLIISVGFYIPRASSTQANALLDQAAIAVKSDPASAFRAFNDLNGKFIQDDLYVFALDMKSLQFMAHGATPRLVGTDARDLKDPTGVLIIGKMIAAVKTKGNGKLDYKWRNPVKEKVENKHTLLRKVDNYLIGVGYYTR